MKHLSFFVSAAACAVLLAGPAYGQEYPQNPMSPPPGGPMADAGAAANAGAASQSGAAAVAGGANTNITFGDSNVENQLQAPSVVPPGNFIPGVNSCAGLGTSAGLSLPGGGAAIGGNRMDQGCDNVRTVEALRRSAWDTPRIAAEVALCLNNEQARQAYAVMNITCEQLPSILQPRRAAAEPSSLQVAPQAPPVAQVALIAPADDLRGTLDEGDDTEGLTTDELSEREAARMRAGNMEADLAARARALEAQQGS